MSAQPLAASSPLTLADTVEQTLTAALGGHDESCLWCGRGPLSVASADRWTRVVKLLCPHCGSELSGEVPRRAMEVRT